MEEILNIGNTICPKIWLWCLEANLETTLVLWNAASEVKMEARSEILSKFCIKYVHAHIRGAIWKVFGIPYSHIKSFSFFSAWIMYVKSANSSLVRVTTFAWEKNWFQVNSVKDLLTLFGTKITTLYVSLLKETYSSNF